MNTTLTLVGVTLALTAFTTVTRPNYELVLEQLQNQDSVITNVLPEVHPKRTTFNAEAPIPPQCYTKTSTNFNPCYVCHQNYKPGRENVMNDGSLQLDYAFSDVGLTNHWQNLFEDRKERAERISNADIIEWVNKDNYTPLKGDLQETTFDGWVPDLDNLHLAELAFDNEGFAKDGSDWVAFNYKPLPSTFWPTNGSTDDVMIRLPEIFRNKIDGTPSRDVYKANLAILEAKIKGQTRVGSLPVDERELELDLNRDGQLSTITTITQVDNYVGAAQDAYVDAYLYPKGTEFLHTVRYLGIDQGSIGPSKRLKELRYMRKWRDFSKAQYARAYEEENFGKEAGRLPRYILLGDKGLDNGFGWSVQGFIENRKGKLRTLTYEENLQCMGCHTSVGSTIDKTFAFPRKVDGAVGWRYIDLKGMPDAPNVGEQVGEIATYLGRVGGGGEFRNNEEMRSRWFDQQGNLLVDNVRNADVYSLITPSVERALQLNKAYRVIVEDQDFFLGRDATLVPPVNVHSQIDNDTTETLQPSFYFEWDIRLAWPSEDQHL